MSWAWVFLLKLRVFETDKGENPPKRQDESTAMGRLHTLASAQANARVGVVCIQV